MGTATHGRRVMALLVITLFLFLGIHPNVAASAQSEISDLIGFSSYLGGTDDESMGVSYAFGDTVVDSKGNIIAVGMSYSDDFPVRNAIQENRSGGRDGIIAKFSHNGSLIFSTYLGGMGQEYIAGVAIDSEDNIILAGETASSDFPIVNSNPPESLGLDCFITKISEDGQSILFSTKFGGSGSDYLYAMCIDADDRIAITGTTASTDLPLLNPSQTTPAGNLEVFVSFFEADGQSLLFSTYLGTSGIDHGRQVRFDSNGDIILAGMIANGDLATEGAYQEAYGGGSSDAFVARYKTNGTLDFLSFLGGADVDTANDMDIDSADNIVITGYTLSDDFPVHNAIQGERTARSEMFVSKFSPNGQNILFSSYVGGQSADYGNAVEVDSQDRIIITGQTDSTDFPLTYATNAIESDYDDVTLVVLDSDGSLLFSWVYGGAHDDLGIGLAWHSNDTFIITGYTKSPDFPVYDAYQNTHSGSNDMFIMKVDLDGLLDAGPSGFTLGIVESSIVIGAVLVVVILLLFVRKRTS